MSNYKYSFFDNQTVGVDHLNEITKRVVSGGISAVYSGVDFNVSDINDTNKAILTGGVVPETDTNLKVTAIGSGRYLINPGLCFFNNGTTMEVLSGGEEISAPLGTKRYVYLVSDANKMACFVEILTSPKQTGEFLLLAVINADGTITDKRTYARGKVPGFYASTEGMSINISQTYKELEFNPGTNIEVTIGEGNFKHLCIVSNGAIFYCEFDENGVAKNQFGRATYQTSNGRFYIFYDTSGPGAVECDVNVRISGGKLVIRPLDGRNSESVTVWYHLW